MMDWSDDAVVLSVRPFGETAALVEVLARAHGRWGGLVHGGASRKTRPALQPGNLLSVAWTARVADQLGRFSRTELLAPHAARALDDGAAVAALASATALLRVATADGSPIRAFSMRWW
jgi:DNA repair protein RecO (recombination protein O)